MLKKDIPVVQQIKHEVLKEVAALAFDGELEQGKGDIPYKIIPGSKARFRCCVHKEREIIRQRVRLARGKSPRNSRGELKERNDNQIVYVIEEACEGCPIHRFQVTENCQGCMAKKCLEACPFGAITIAGKRAHIDQDKCRECGRCSKACPYNAIADLMRPCKRSCPVGAISMDDEKKAVIDETKCINCGACTTECPFGAMEDISCIVNVIEDMKNDREVYAVFAPSIAGQFGKDVTTGAIKNALIRLGFDGTYEVALGADWVAVHEAKEVAENIDEMGFMTTSCCPAFVAMVEKHFPKLLPHVSNTVSPMVAIGRYIKAEHPKSKVVFIGPCMAKKAESKKEWARDAIDYVITFEELAAMMDAKNIEIHEKKEKDDASGYGRGFAKSGGVYDAVCNAAKENNITLNVIPQKCNGAEECRKALMMANTGRLNENFIEGMVCQDGCIGGPGTLLSVVKTKRELDKNAKESSIKNINDSLNRLKGKEVDLKR